MDAFKYLPYGSDIVSIMEIPRKRAVYLQFARGLKLYRLWISSQKEARNECPPADIKLIVGSNKCEDIKASVLSLKRLDKYSCIKLEKNLYGWLRIVKLSTDYRRVMYWDPETEKITIDYSRRKEIVTFPSMYLKYIDVLQQLGWVTATDNTYEITNIGRQAMHTYYKIASRQKMNWSMKLPTLPLMGLVRYLRIRDYRLATYDENKCK